MIKKISNNIFNIFFLVDELVIFTLESNWQHRVIPGVSILANTLLEVDLVFQEYSALNVLWNYRTK